jgi:hypothetical protein
MNTLHIGSIPYYEQGMFYVGQLLLIGWELKILKNQIKGAKTDYYEYSSY